MMPGETPPPPAGTAAAAGGPACANCGVLQQNINEYVAALIALKQKMIDGDRLLTEYQQKCTELQFAEREISALRCQVEQMLQKILPLEKCQEELGSLKAELEEKKSSLKIYRESQLEYVKIKEEIVNSDAVRKKLETKVKKLEEAATKHTQDFRQLKTEKKRLEKELKKAQGKLDGVLKEKCRKVKHAETQSSSEDLTTDIDKEKIKLLLEELWMCIDSATGKRENQENDPVLASIQDKAWPEKRRLTVTEETVQIHQKIRKCDGKTLPWYSSLESAGKQNSLTAMQLQASTEPFGGDCVENRPTEECLRSGEDKTVGVIIQTDGAHSSSDFSDQEQKGPGGNVMDILNWARPLPALLSPVQLSPPTTQDMLFGEVTGSSDEEVDCSASAVEDILQEDQVQPQSCNVFSHNEEFKRQSKSCQQGLDAEISCNLSWNENNVHIGPQMSSKEERDAETKQAEAAALITNTETNKDCLEENSENMETEKRELTEATADELEATEEQKGDGEDIRSEEGGSSADFMLHSFKPQNQLKKCSEVAQTEENVILIRAVDYEGTHEEHGEFMKAESNGLSGERETPRAVSVPQNVTHLPPEQCIVLQSEGSEEKSDVLIQNEVVENESKNVIEVTSMASDVGENIKEVIIGEKITAAIQIKGLCAEANNESELSENVLSDFSSLKSFCEVECSKDLVIQRHGEGIIMETEADTGAIEMSAHSECSEIKHDSEEILEKQCVQTIKDEADRKCKPETVKVSRHYLPVSATEGIRNLLSMDDTDKNVGMERPALSAFPKDDAQLRTEDMNITRPETIELAMKFNRESVLEIAESSEILHSAENGKLVDIREGGYLKGKPHQEENGSNSSQGKSDLESVLALPKTACITDVESSVAKCESSVLDFTEIEGEIKQPENLCSALECGLSKTQNFRVFESQETEFKVNPEDFEAESNELLERVDTIESVLVESNVTSEAQFAKPLNQFSVTENVKCDEIKGELNKQSKELVTETCSTSFNWEENVVKKNNASEIICHSEMDFHSGLAFSAQGDLEMGCINTEETDSPVQVGTGLESTMPPDLNFHLQKVVSFAETDFTEKAAFSHIWENKEDKNCVTGSAFNCSSESLEEGAEILSAEKDNMCKEPDCPEREYVHKNEVKIPSEKEQPVDKEPQAPVKSQILDPNSYNKNTFLQKSECQESGCRTSTWKVGTEPSATGSLTAGGESKELNSSEPLGKNAIKRSKNGFDMPEQSNESEEKDCSIQKVPMFRKELRASRRIAVGALETGAIVDADYQGRELHSTMHPGNTLTVSHTKADTVVDMYTRCETNSSPDTANELSDVVGEGYPKDLASWKRKYVVVTSENTEGANECMVDSNRAGCINDSEDSLLKTGTSKESPVMPNASKNRLPLCQTLTRFPETCRLAVKDSKLNSRMLALGNFLEENDSEKLQSDVGQGLLHGVDMGVSVFEEYNHNQTHTASNMGENNTDVILDGSSRKKNCVKCLPNPALSDVECNCQTVRQPPEPQKTAFEKLCMLESESCVDVTLKKSNKLKCKEQEPSEILTVSTKTTAQVMHAKLSKRLFQGKRKTKTLKVRQTQPVLANADTSMPTKCSSETINKIRQEMGPPLPPLLLPLIATPPKAACTMSPVMSSTGRSSLLSPLDDLISPLRETPVPPLMSPLRDTPTVKSALLFSPPSPSEMAVGRRICSSPLKFCTSIPKHALPVPGRFPLLAADSAAPGAPQENSVKILDTMYPELSARARTLNILKGNIQLNRCAFSDSQSLPGPVAQIGGFKAIASTSTAFVKTGSNLKSDSSKDQDKDVQNQQLFSSSSNHLEKRTPLPISMPRSAKRLRLDSEPPKLEPNDTAAIEDPKNTISDTQEAFHDKSCEISDSSHSSSLEASLPVKKVIDPDCQKVSLALKKIAESCFDLLPVIKGHVYVGNISKIPIMRDEEKEVVYEFGIKNKVLGLDLLVPHEANTQTPWCLQHLAESLLHVILNKLKAQKNATNYNFNQALCRVYTGICRQLGDLERARIFCYSLLKEDFPDSEKLILFIINVWSDIFVFQGAINKAMQLVVRQSASNEMLACFSAYLNWEQSSSLDAGIMVSNLLLEMQSCPKVEFQLSEHYGEDLSEDAWQYIFAVDLLCSRLKWDWTHDNVISKVLWPSMDKWVKKRKGHETAQSIPDSVIALTLRLIGRLGQIGLKEGYLAAVKNISSVIGLFVQHAKEEGVPWGVQLAAIYSLCDLGSSNPEGIVEAIHAWRATVLNNIPFAVTSGIAEITSLCKMELN
ncbi:little elongation complex subunit 1 isoform X2 [Harpia harpyja]|uniref:little elongation complex subunit 1 isoform X2 n=1 Tax=Harpia harpyja TaxID=202280 RepID=UPI0022B14EDD|nr:little elongation complex subunit 1 isoform X2 [Harpia harpyja]